jgi:uncharacterized cupredoxin-like copper-binding protein
VLLPALTSSAKVGLAVTAAVFVGFSLIAALVIPRRRPDFPARHLTAFLIACVVLFVAMMTSVIVFGGKEKAETEAAREKLPVGESDYSVELSRTNLSPGLYTIEVTNYGQITHNLTVKGPGVTKGTRKIEPGKSASLPIELKRGTYVLYSSLPGQQQDGVTETVTVD